MKITLCSSAKFFDKLPEIKKALEETGYEVLLPSMVDHHHLEETALTKKMHGLIEDHFSKIDESDAIFVANFDKNGIKNYIGGSAFMEMALAFHNKIPIFLLNEVPKDLNYREELIALQPIVIGKDWDKLDKILKNKS
ncbi:hypothetical protein KO317_01175 [Candidatus Micrarchaeota archaeon]|nr:hypothetical protein [Candidatus Micrarchaeota archaeon]